MMIAEENDPVLVEFLEAQKALVEAYTERDCAVYHRGNEQINDDVKHTVYNAQERFTDAFAAMVKYANRK